MTTFDGFGPKVQEWFKGLEAKMFRQNRDLRFAPDKSPWTPAPG